MRKTNYKFEKRQKDLDKLRKKEEKLKKKQERKGLGEPGSNDAGDQGDDAAQPTELK